MVDGVVIHVRGSSTKKKIPCEPVRNGEFAGEGGGKPGIDVATAPFKRFRPRLQRLRPRYALRPKTEWPVRPNVHLTPLATSAAPHVLTAVPSFVLELSL